MAEGHCPFCQTLTRADFVVSFYDDDIIVYPTWGLMVFAHIMGYVPYKYSTGGLRILLLYFLFTLKSVKTLYFISPAATS